MKILVVLATVIALSLAGISLLTTEQISHPTASHHRIAGTKRYMLFIKPQPHGQFATLHFGPDGIFEVGSDNNIVPLVGRNRHSLARSIADLGADSKELSKNEPKSKLELFRAFAQQQGGR